MNINAMMRQAQEVQKRMGEMQERLARIEVEGQSGGGMVKAVLNGKGEARKLAIDPSLVVKEDVEMLEDLVVAAFNDAKGKAEQEIQRQTQEIMSGLKLPPGVKLPF
jgi:DNA-binding YbaB/EbfC family protein